MLFAADQELRCSLLKSLAEQVEGAIAIRAEDYFLAIGCPGPGKILPFVPGQEPWRFQSGPVGFNSGDIDIRLPALFYVGQPLSVGRVAEVLNLPWTSCKPRGWAYRL